MTGGPMSKQGHVFVRTVLFISVILQLSPVICLSNHQMSPEFSSLLSADFPQSPSQLCNIPKTLKKK